MQIKNLLAAAAAVSCVAATPTFGLGLGQSKSVPGYPWGLGNCLNDQQAAFVVKQFKSILTNPDRKAAAATAQVLLADNYVETSDSINVLAGEPEGGASFNSKQAFIQGVAGAPAIPVMNDLDMWHDCTKIGWQWLVNGLALNVSPVKGINKIVVNPQTGVIQTNDIEFNSIAWGRDLGWTCTPPPQ